MNKLIKINEQHYVVCNDSEIKKGDWVINNLDKLIGHTIRPISIAEVNDKEYSKITHSTQPLVHPNCCIAKEGITNMNKGCSERNRCLGDVQIIPLSEVEEAINGYTPMQLARQSAVDNNYDIEDDVYKHGFVEGFKAHQELVKDKLFTTEDIRKAIKMAWEADSIDGTVDLNIVLHYGNNNDLRTKWSEEEIIQSLLPKTEWDIEFIDGKIKLL